MKKDINITVLLVVHNCENYIEECIKSIINQTYKDFELLIINDGSTDKTVECIKTFTDDRIRLINQTNNNFISSLNIGLSEANGRYIARMDGDDLMRANRLIQQYEIMESQPKVALCCSSMQCFGSSDNVIQGYSGIIKNPLVEMMRYNIVAHPTVMLRKSFLEKHNLSYQNYQYAEDYKLWSEMAKCGAFFWAIPDVLLDYRCSTDQVSFRKRDKQASMSFKIQQEIIYYLISHYNKQDDKIEKLYEQLISFNEKDELSSSLILEVFQEIFRRKEREKLVNKI